MKEFWIDTCMLEKPNTLYAYTNIQDAEDRGKGNIIHVVDVSEYKKLEEKNQILRMQLVACAVAALSNTFELIKLNRITKENPYWSGSYDLVCDTVDREIALRLKLETTGE
jgi:hypothetical protein